MLFNSYFFVFFFLPLVLAVFWLLKRLGRVTQIAWLTAASIAFYAYWDPRFVGLLVGSMLFNYAVGQCLTTQSQHALSLRLRFWILAGGIAANLAVLGFFKYYGFLSTNLIAVTEIAIPHLDLILPLGISFFTFTQIAFLVDAYRGEVRECRLINYALFVSYFPHLIAGPLYHHKEMMSQFAKSDDTATRFENLALGLTIFIIGLAKKVLLADSLAIAADRVFLTETTGITFIEAWCGTLAFSLQLYFDFSGYSDMAIGISKMFGIDLPLNFNSPYKAGNIIEFWRRWHMTLSRFLRDYLYIPLGGNRHGQIRRYENLLITMLLGGLWHGAAWTFVIWGGLHGLFLAINHAWHGFRRWFGFATWRSKWWSHALGVGLTFAGVSFAWAFFRAESLASALDIVRGMAGLNGAPIPHQWLAAAGSIGEWLIATGVPTADLQRFLGGRYLVLIAVLFLAVWTLPNTQEITGYLATRKPAIWSAAELWRPSPLWAAVCGVLAVACLNKMAEPMRFLYFQF